MSDAPRARASRRQFAFSAAAAAMATMLPSPASGAPSAHLVFPLASRRLAQSWVTPSGEPVKTILQGSWHAARNRARRLPQNECALFLSLLDSVESAWPHVRALQHLHDQFRPTATGAFARVLDFIDDHVCDLFRSVVWKVVVFVPGPGGEMAGEPDFDNTDGEADQFENFVAILRSACCDPEVPRSAATAVREATEPLLTWYDQLEPLLKRAADAVQGGT